MYVSVYLSIHNIYICTLIQDLFGGWEGSMGVKEKQIEFSNQNDSQVMSQ